MKIFGARFALFVVGSQALIWTACTQPQKQADSSDKSPKILRNVASPDAPMDFDPNRAEFDGSGRALIDAMKGMRGVPNERGVILGLSEERENLLRYNIFDTGVDTDKNLDCATEMAGGRKDFILHHRTPEGVCYMYNQGQFQKGKTNETDLSHLKQMGSRGTRFGRNTPPPTAEQIAEFEKSLMVPNPVTVSKTFFARKPELSPETKGFQPVPWVNLLATAWLQAENHDWFSHGKNVVRAPEALQGQFAKAFEPYHIDGFMIPRTRPDLSALKGEIKGQKETSERQYGAKYRNTVTHWWDASHIYGSDAETVRRIRTIPSGVTYKDASGKTYAAGQIYPDGKIAVDEVNRKLYYRPDPNNDNEVLPVTGFNDNWWIGLELIHTTFALEHNKVVDHLKAEFEKTIVSKKSGLTGLVNSLNLLKGEDLYSYYASIKNDEQKRSDFLYNKARLVVAALIAKIHTVEWTPALLDNPGLRMGMFANWNGLKTAAGDVESVQARGLLEALLGPRARMLISGLTGEGTLNQYGVPFTLTQEFVSVYRMHPLLPDDINVIRPVPGKDTIAATVPVDSSRDGEVEKLYGAEGFTAVDWMYSFGRNRAGLMTLHNYPKFMESMEIRRNIQDQKKDQPLKMNMGAVDVMRDRERQTPRYNAFRRALRMRPIDNFEELFVTSKVLYEDASGQSTPYQAVVEKLRNQIRAAGYDIDIIERDPSKIPAFDLAKALGDYKKGGREGFLGDGKKRIPEGDFYAYYFRLPLEEQRALLTKQEIEDVANMKRLYDNDVDKLDFLVGTLAEKDRYDRFGFGNTPFYIFVLMASRRLMSDPFYGDLYTDAVYSKAGRDWVEKNTMVDVITRNFPELKPNFVNVKNAFHPWNPN